MGESIQAHYLPKSAYLSFFENAEKKGHLYLYQRGSAPVLVGTGKAAREHNLYSFRDRDGHLNADIERFLERIESEARPTLEKLNAATESLDVPAEEWEGAAKFIAFQHVRTPAFRRQLQDMSAAMMKATMRRVAQDDRMFQRAIRSTRESKSDFPDIGLEELRAFILSGEYDIAAKGDYFLGLVLKMVDHAYRGVMVKTPLIYRSTNESFITCDSPVILLRHPKSPPHWGAGWVNSHVLFPLGKHAGLFLQAKPGHVRKMDGPVRVTVRKAGGRLAWMNKHTANAAERFVFADKSLKAIVRLFSTTKKPTRFKLSSLEGTPFVFIRQN